MFSVALSVPGVTRSLPVRKYGALCCPDFPLRIKACGAIRRLACQKYKIPEIGSRNAPLSHLHPPTFTLTLTLPLVYVLPGKAELKPVRNICHLLDHFLNEFGCGVVVGAGSHDFEKTVLENKAAVVKRAILFQQVT